MHDEAGGPNAAGLKCTTHSLTALRKIIVMHQLISAADDGNENYTHTLWRSDTDNHLQHCLAFTQLQV